MSKSELWKGVAALAITALLTACAAPATAPAQPPVGAATPPPTAAAAGGQKVSASGFACPEPQFPLTVTSKELNIFVWTEYIPQDIFDCFEQVYGIKVNRDEYSSNEELYAKLNAGGTNYDVVQPGNRVVPLMIRQGLLQKLDHAQLPVLAGFDPNYLDLTFDPGNAYTIPYEAGTDAIVVNTDKVKGDLPQKWADLWNPDYAGRMVFLDDARDVIGLTLLTLGYDPNTAIQSQLDEAKAKLAELVPNVKVFDSDSPKTELIAGDVDLGMTWTGEAFLAAQANPAIQYIYPAEGAILWQDNYGIPTGATHLDAAYAWFNYSMQANLFWLMLRDFPYTNPSLAALEYAKNSTLDIVDAEGNPTTPAKLYQAYIDSPVTNTPAAALANGHMIEDVGEATPLYDKIWTEVKGG